MQPIEKIQYAYILFVFTEHNQKVRQQMDTQNKLLELREELRIWFTDEILETMAKTTGFIKRRSSRLSAKEFFNLVTVDVLQEPNISYQGLCDKLESRNPAISITPQALCERMNTQAAVTFMRNGFENTLKKTMSEKKLL